MKKLLVLGLGSNMGNRYAYIQLAINSLKLQFNSEILVSNVYQTPPWGNTNQASFLNTVVALDTDKDAYSCFLLVKEIEKQLGRTTGKHWGPRPIDIDILFLDKEVSSNNNVVIPHPRIGERSFVIIPASDLLPNLVHPTFQVTLLELSKQVSNDCQLFVQNIKP